MRRQAIVASDAGGATHAAYQQAISTRKQRDPRRDPPFSFELRSVAGGRVSGSSSRYSSYRTCATSPLRYSALAAPKIFVEMKERMVAMDIDW